MREDIPKKIIDATGIELMPGKPSVCLGNGELGFECCCDECDYFLFCFPEFDPEKRNKTSMFLGRSHLQEKYKHPASYPRSAPLPPIKPIKKELPQTFIPSRNGSLGKISRAVGSIWGAILAKQAEPPLAQGSLL